jgi:hypothetical protein
LRLALRLANNRRSVSATEVNLMMRLDGVNLFIRSPRPSEQVSGDGKELRPGTHIAVVEGPDHTRIELLQRDVPVG